jgi:hypothetical protein
MLAIVGNVEYAVEMLTGKEVLVARARVLAGTIILLDALRG